MTLWDMRLRFDMDESDLLVIHRRIKECVEEIDPPPEFLTVKAAHADAMDLNRHQPPPKGPVMAREPEHRRTGRNRRAI